MSGVQNQRSRGRRTLVRLVAWVVAGAAALSGVALDASPARASLGGDVVTAPLHAEFYPLVADGTTTANLQSIVDGPALA